MLASPDDYECQVGLWLNLRRTENRRTAAVLGGVQQAISGLVSHELIQALSFSDEEAKAEINRYEASRQDSE